MNSIPNATRKDVYCDVSCRLFYTDFGWYSFCKFQYLVKCQVYISQVSQKYSYCGTKKTYSGSCWMSWRAYGQCLRSKRKHKSLRTRVSTLSASHIAVSIFTLKQHSIWGETSESGLHRVTHSTLYDFI